jgi:hypothetical protein
VLQPYSTSKRCVCLQPVHISASVGHPDRTRQWMINITSLLCSNFVQTARKANVYIFCLDILCGLAYCYLIKKKGIFSIVNWRGTLYLWRNSCICFYGEHLDVRRCQEDWDNCRMRLSTCGRLVHWCCYGDAVTEGEMGWECGTYGGDDKYLDGQRVNMRLVQR